jgi:hypothetical membrane protein
MTSLTFLSPLSNPVFIRNLAVIGTFFVLVGSSLAAFVYRGKMGERYSPMNHFISELGERGVSRAAAAFNIGLILCGLCLLPAIIGLGLQLDSLFGWLGTAAGLVAGISLILVGCFPMDALTPHIRAAVTYFRSGLLMVLFFTVGMVMQPAGTARLNPLLGLAGVPAVLAFGFFLVYSRVSMKAKDSALAPLEGDRPRLWGLAIAEWLIFLTTIPWLLAIGLGG